MDDNDSPLVPPNDEQPTVQDEPRVEEPPKVPDDVAALVEDKVEQPPAAPPGDPPKRPPVKPKIIVKERPRRWPLVVAVLALVFGVGLVVVGLAKKGAQSETDA